MIRNTYSLNGELDITLQKGKVFSSLQVKITAMVLAVLFVALIIINIIIISAVGNSLVQQKARDKQNDVSMASNKISELIWYNKWDEVKQYCIEYGEENNCRVLVFNTGATVAIDNFDRLYGTKFENKEAKACLVEGASTSWGTYKITVNNDADFVSDYTPNNGSEYWAMYVSSRIEYNDELVGALLISVPFQDLVDQVDALTWYIIFISFIVGIMVSIVLVLLLRKHFNPLHSMSRAISLMSKGDFSVRALPGNGHDELNELANPFNSMCAKMELLDDSRNKFVSDASHEMKTPLATMKILVDSLLNQSGEMDKDIYNEFLGDISHEIDRLTYLINDLLVLVRMDNTQVAADMVPIQITDLLDKVRHKLQPLAAMKGIDIIFKAEGDPTVMGNSMKLQQAFTNLVDNAIKYSSEDTTITVSVTKNSEYAVASVIDQGIGISNENLERIFERFYRVDKARSRETGGTGLGLSIVEGIVKQHNGHIDVHSKQGRGTTFTVSLPLQTHKITGAVK